MARTKIIDLPTINVAAGQVYGSPQISVPNAALHVFAELDGTLWPVGSTITIAVYLSLDNGVTWLGRDHATFPQSWLIAGKCLLGKPFDAGAKNRKIRVEVSHDASAPVALVGSAWWE